MRPLKSGDLFTFAAGLFAASLVCSGAAMAQSTVTERRQETVVAPMSTTTTTETHSMERESASLPPVRPSHRRIRGSDQEIVDETTETRTFQSVPAPVETTTTTRNTSTTTTR